MGEHYFRLGGLCPRFKWSAVQAWLEVNGHPMGQGKIRLIPTARGYSLGKPAYLILPESRRTQRAFYFRAFFEFVTSLKVGNTYLGK